MQELPQSLCLVQLSLFCEVISFDRKYCSFFSLKFLFCFLWCLLDTNESFLLFAQHKDAEHMSVFTYIFNWIQNQIGCFLLFLYFQKLLFIPTVLILVFTISSRVNHNHNTENSNGNIALHFGGVPFGITCKKTLWYKDPNL